MLTNKPLYYSLLTLSVFFSAGVVFYTFWLQHFTVNLYDMPYQIMNGMYVETCPASILSNVLMHFWGATFGFGFLSMRNCMVTLSLATALASSAYHYHLTRKLPLSIALFGMMIIMTNFNATFGWDAFTFLFTTLLLVQSLHTQRHPNNLLNYVCLGALSALTFFCRMPNVVSVPMLLFVIWLINRGTSKNKLLRYETTYVATLFIVILILVYVLFGGIQNYIEQWKQYSLINRHSMNLLIMNYMVSLNDFVILFALFFSAMKMVDWCVEKVALRASSMKNVVYVLFLLFFTLYLFRHLYFNCANDDFLLRQIFIVLFFFVLFCQMMYDKNYWTTAVIIALLSLIPPAGSNLGLQKTMALYALPIALAYERLTKSQIVIIVSVMMVMALILVPQKRRDAWYDAGYVKCTTPVNVPLLEGIYTTPENAQFVKNVYNATKDLERHEVLYMGPQSLMFEYLSEYRHAFDVPFFDRNYNDSRYIKAALEYIEESDVKYVLALSDSAHDSELFLNQLEEYGFYMESDGDGYVLCKRTPASQKH